MALSPSLELLVGYLATGIPVLVYRHITFFLRRRSAPRTESLVLLAMG
jgi:hypothetical protein